jgi:hypothetical protein
MDIQSDEDCDKQNATLREHGYRWRKRDDGSWQLYDRGGSIVSVSEAMSRIESGQSVQLQSQELNRTERNNLFRKNGYYWNKPERVGGWVIYNRHGKPVQMNEHDLCNFILANPERYQQERHKARAEALQLAHDLVENDAFVLDCETTGRHDLKVEEVIELSILQMDGTVLLRSFVHCDARIDPEATEKSSIPRGVAVCRASNPWEAGRNMEC